VPGDRGPPDAGPRAHVDFDSAKYSVAQAVGYIKGKSAIHVARTFFDQKRNFVGAHFWARGYFVSTVGRDEATVREYIRNQEAEDKRLEQLRLP
jgi:putative transposase